MANGKIIWTQQVVRNNVDKVVMRNLERAAIFVEGIVVRSISIGQSIRRLPSGGVVGLNPSKPGNPPHVLLGFLRKSITHKVFKIGNKIVAIVGSGMVYARRLEKGFIGRDRAGRNVNQAARPFLRPAVSNNKDQIGLIISTGAAGLRTARRSVYEADRTAGRRK